MNYFKKRYEILIDVLKIRYGSGQVLSLLEKVEEIQKSDE